MDLQQLGLLARSSLPDMIYNIPEYSIANVIAHAAHSLIH
jgi:hypothetical protein